MTVEKILALYEKRDLLSKSERKLEDEIFNETKVHTGTEIQRFAREYRKIKDRRSEAGVKASVAYMEADPDIRKLATFEWAQRDEGKRKASTTGIRGSKD